MYWQSLYEREGTSMDRNDTYEYDLPKSGLIGSMLLRIAGDQILDLGIGGGSWRLIDFLDKIEIVFEGNVAIKSLTGKQLQAMAFYDQKIVAPDVWRNYGENTQFCFILINFGRYLYDIDYGLDLSKFSSVKLKVKNIATTADFSDTLSVSILSQYLRDAPVGQFKGYMRTESWKDWTPSADGTEYMELPEAFPIRRILLQAIYGVDSDYKEYSTFWNLMDDILLELKTRTSRVFKGGLDDLVRLNHWDIGGEVMCSGALYGNADKGYRFGVGYPTGWAGVALTKDGAESGINVTLDPGETKETVKPEAIESETLLGLFIRGQGYHETGLIRFDQSPNPAVWLDPKAQRVVNLDIHTRSGETVTNAKNYVILDRLVRY